jgi:hypothetical protein
MTFAVRPTERLAHGTKVTAHVLVAALGLFVGGCAARASSPSGTSGAIAEPEGGAPPDGGNGSLADGATPDGATKVADSGPGGLVLSAPPATKIDMLFDIDNSTSMGDKQSYLTQAIPALIARFVSPNCVDGATPPNVNGTTAADGTCPAGFKPEFAPVTDLHVGVVTSSLGSRLSDMSAGPNGTVMQTATGLLCDPNAMVPGSTTLSDHNDDRGELITRELTSSTREGVVADAQAAGYLYWFPAGTSTDPATPLTSSMQLETDFAGLVQGAGVSGCGIESQLESWYRFLIQPDPYDHLVLNPPGDGGNTRTFASAGWAGVDATILQQRHDFLRPDSAVIVVVLSDENDSEIDVRSFQGTGYIFMHADYDPPHATTACATDPDDPTQCQSCTEAPSDPNCTANGGYYTAPNDWGFDPNLRHVHMLQKYGLDVQYPISRYYIGLTSAVVPNRDGEYPAGAANYVGCVTDPTTNLCVPNCTNPLFAASLPNGQSPQDDPHLCNLPLGSRSSQQVFFAHIGGVPHELLHFDPDSMTNSQLSQADWTRILGQGAADYLVGGSPLAHDYTGIDPHMIESYSDRTQDPLYVGGAVDKSVTDIVPSGAADATDPVSGREWVTDQPLPTFTNGATLGHVLPVDREYACTFPLQSPRDCTASDAPGCDCPPSSGMGLTSAEVPPICDPANPSSQIAAKAYPTIRELLLTKLMGQQGIVSSLCPIDTTEPSDGGFDPSYGYNPVVPLIVNRLKPVLAPPR